MRSEESKDIKGLLLLMSEKTYTSSYCDCKQAAHDILDKAISLFEADYNTVEISNKSGKYSENYPCRIVIPVSSRNDDMDKAERFDYFTCKEELNYAHLARCRKRFPVPVMLFRGKYICRSSTIATVPEICSRVAVNMTIVGTSETSTREMGNNPEPPSIDTTSTLIDSVDDSLLPEIPPDDIQKQNNDESQLTFPSRVTNFYRSHDIQLLKSLNVGTIVDLMVENKKVKYFLTVSSSEKIDKENRYSDFRIIPLPYPGCEFFAEYKRRNYASKGLYFNWNQVHCNATVDIPEYLNLNIPWSDYKTWDLLTLTKNYFRVLLSHISDPDQNGILIHCISGWDRTPLFISLLRMSLWADGLIHKSLDEQEILYLTLAYDWFLFGHNLPDRLAKGEVILFFCFSLLKYIDHRRFSLMSSDFSSSPSIPEDIDNSNDGFENMEDLSSSSEALNGNDFYSNHDSNSSSSFTENGNACSSNSGSSPMAVPNSERTRRKTDSMSSTGSWQMVSQCGSLRSPEPILFNIKSNKNANVSPGSSSSETETDLIYRKRKERLERVRAIFLHCYCTTFDINHIPGIFETFFCDKVGVNQK